jgi:tetratricopeptide (TPR) repeat protein
LDAWVALATILIVNKNGGPEQPEKQGKHPPKGIVSGEPRDPAGSLLRAMGSKEAARKRSFAEKGLRALTPEDDEELQGLLLRQVYLADIEEGHDLQALQIASEMIELGTLGEIARQDAARAALGAQDIEAAIGHLRVATQVCPPERRAFHYGHLGALLRFDGQAEEAAQAFEKALRWANTHHLLYQAQRALALVAAGAPSDDLDTLRTQLESQEDRPAYSLWVLGELCLLLGDLETGRSYLRLFLARQEGAPRAKSLALKGEIDHATTLLRANTA